jgi:hypothetical protein
MFDLQPDEDIAFFIFSDKQGNRLFPDSLAFEDFRISVIKGDIELLNGVDTFYNDIEKNFSCASVGFYPNDTRNVLAYFHYKDDADTVEVVFNKKRKRDIESIIYNGSILERGSWGNKPFYIYK